MSREIDIKTKLLSENEVMLEGITKRTAKVGAKVFSMVYGLGTIVEINKYKYPITAEFTVNGDYVEHTFTFDGRYTIERACELYLVPKSLEGRNFTKVKPTKYTITLKLKADAKKVRTN